MTQMQTSDTCSQKDGDHESQLQSLQGEESNDSQARLEDSLEAQKGITSQQYLASDREKGTKSTEHISPGPAADGGLWNNEPPDPNIIDWDGPDDPANPLNWSSSKRWANIMLVSIITFTIPLASTMFAPSVPQLLDEFSTRSDSLATFVVSVYVLGLAIGPLVLPPMSELYGRAIIYHVGNVFFVVFTAACGLSTNIHMLIGFRFLAGLVGAGALTIGGGSIADLTTVQQRGRAMNIWSVGFIVGPAIGPIAGGFLAEAKGWRWIFWVLTIVSGAITIIGLVFLRETNAVVLLKEKTRRLQRETGNMQLRSKLDSGVAPRELFLRAILRPSKLLVMSPVCLLLSVYNAFNYAVLYFMFSTFSFVFRSNSYRFTPGTVGLVYIALGIGMLIGIVVQQATGNRIMKKLSEKEADGKSRPEHRLPIMMLGGILIPLGLFVYGWTAQHGVHWAVPLLGTLILGAGMHLSNISMNLYLVDSFTTYAASALGAPAVLRSICGATFPLFALQLFDKLGLGWGNSLLAFIALAMWPVGLVFIKYGEHLRTAPRFQAKL